MPDLPDDVVEHLRSIFSGCNARAAEKLSANPNAPEESFDLTWIEHMSRYSSAVTLASDWLVKIETHYLGGMRHFRRWEIADVGLLVHLRLGKTERRSKVALLQSKRLYPDGTPVREETLVDYEIGFARLADPEDEAMSLAFATEFSFSTDSSYGQIRASSEQVAAIQDYEQTVGLKVYYQLYNPWVVPFVQRVPLVGYDEQEGEPEVGVRVVPAHILHALLEANSLISPRLSDLTRLVPSLHSGGGSNSSFATSYSHVKRATSSSQSAMPESNSFSTVGQAPSRRRLQSRSKRRTSPSQDDSLLCEVSSHAVLATLQRRDPPR